MRQFTIRHDILSHQPRSDGRRSFLNCPCRLIARPCKCANVSGEPLKVLLWRSACPPNLRRMKCQRSPTGPVARRGGVAGCHGCDMSKAFLAILNYIGSSSFKFRSRSVGKTQADIVFKSRVGEAILARVPRSDGPRHARQAFVRNAGSLPKKPCRGHRQPGSGDGNSRSSEPSTLPPV